MLKLIVAYDKNKLIGDGSKLPWSIPEDIVHFKREVKNKILILGETTFIGLNIKLPSDKIYVLSKKDKLTHPLMEKFEIVNSINKVLKMSKKNEVYILGGSSVFEQFLDYVDLMIITKLNKTYKGNVYFPDWEEKNFKEIKQKKLNSFATVFYYQRI